VYLRGIAPKGGLFDPKRINDQIRKAVRVYVFNIKNFKVEKLGKMDIRSGFLSGGNRYNGIAVE
jgi:hypothetical protein